MSLQEEPQHLEILAHDGRRVGGSFLEDEAVARRTDQEREVGRRDAVRSLVVAVADEVGCAELGWKHGGPSGHREDASPTG